jgi:hypothetical protein
MKPKRGWRRRHGENLLHTTTRRCDEELLLSIWSAATIAIREELIVGKRMHIVIIFEH